MMFRAKHALFAVVMTIIVFLLDSTAEARYYRGGGYGGGGAQTPESADANAMANVIRSQGAYNVATTRAMINFERARGSYLQNQKLAMEVYYARRRAVLANRAAEFEMEKAKIQRYQQYLEQAHLNAPKLNSKQLNPSTGEIQWPKVLQQSNYSDLRNSIDSYFASRAKNGGSPQDTKKANDNIISMGDELRNHIHDVVTSDYLESRKFLDLLMYEINHPRS